MESLDSTTLVSSTSIVRKQVSPMKKAVTVEKKSILYKSIKQTKIAFVVPAQTLDDLLSAKEYNSEIYTHMKQLEMERLPTLNYMSNQPELTWNMRSTLISWLIQAHALFNFNSQTLFQTVDLIDRFLSKTHVGVSKLQLVGAACLFISAKFEEVRLPNVGDLMYISSNAYTVKEIVDAERHILNTLQYEISTPSPLFFMNQIAKADPTDLIVANYLAEVALCNEVFVGIPCSKIAAGCMLFAREVSDKQWTGDHVELSGYSRNELVSIGQALFGAVKTIKSKCDVVFQKYAMTEYHGASTWIQKFIDRF